MTDIRSNELEGESDEKTNRTLKQVLRLMFLNACAWLMMMPARPEMILRISDGDPAKASKTMGLMSSSAGLLEFFITQLLGRVSDKIGRKPMMLATASVGCFFRYIDFLFANSSRNKVIVASWLDRCLAGACYPAFLTVARAAINDVIAEQADLAKLGGPMSAWNGAGMIFGPFVGAKVLSLSGDPKYTCLTASLFGLFTMLYVQTSFDETLHVTKRHDIDWYACNPFACLQLFTKSSTILRVSLLNLVQVVMSMMHDTKMIMLRSTFGFSPDDIGRYMLGYGMITIAGGILGQKSMRGLGQWWHTCICQVFEICSLSSWAVAKSGKGVTFGLLLEAMGQQRGLATSAALSTLAAKTGMPLGQVAASVSNIANLGKILGPYAYTTLFSRYGQAAPFLACICCGLIAQAFHHNLADPKHMVFKD